MFSSDLIDFNSPMRQADINFSTTNSSPGSNPFDSVIKMIENAPQQPEFVDSLSVNVEEYFLNCNTGDFLEKESLGILKLEKLNSSFGSDLIFINSECKTPRDSVSSSLNRAFLLSSSSRGFPSVSTVSAAYGSCVNSGSLDVEPSHCQTFEELPEGDDDVFEDLCYIEARHWASKLSDHSNLISDNFFEDTLDSTTPPELVSLEEPEEKIIDTDTVFREIDKVVPALVEDIIETKAVTCSFNQTTTDSDPKNLVNNLNPSNNEAESSCDPNLDLDNNVCVPENLVSNPDLPSNEIEIPRDLKKSVTNLASADNQIKKLCDPKKIINENKNSNQEEKVQKHDYFNYSYEALDLTINKTNNDEVLDLSMKSSRNENRRLSRSFTLPSQMKLFNTKKSESISDCIKPISNPKLKSKKIEDRGSKVSKGPLKAVIPVIDMSKRWSGKIARVTPPKVRTPSLFKMKTSTPINKPQMMPVAQSTPQITSESRDQSIKKEKFFSPVFRTKRQNSDAPSSNNSSRSSSAFSSTPNLSNLSNQSGNSKRDSFIPTSKPVHRRHYSTGFQPTETKAILARSYSVSPDHKQILSNKLKQTSFVSKTPTPKVKTKESPQSKQVLNEKNCGSVIKNLKSLNLLGKVKKNIDGKENLKKN